MIGNVTRQILHLVDEAAEEVDGDGQTQEDQVETPVETEKVWQLT